jgi:hypothetical protein
MPKSFDCTLLFTGHVYKTKETLSFQTNKKQFLKVSKKIFDSSDSINSLSFMTQKAAKVLKSKTKSKVHFVYLKSNI